MGSPIVSEPKYSNRLQNLVFLIGFIWIIFYLVTGCSFINSRNYNDQEVIGTYKTKFFTRRSKELLEQMKLGGLSEQSLIEFAMMEDEFLRLEKQTVCHHISYLREAMTLDQQMKDRFLGWDFGYHQLHIRQMSQPSKIINKHLSCS